MTEKDVKILLFIVAGIATAVGGYFLYLNLHKFKSKGEAVSYLMQRDPSKDANLLMQFDDAFVMNWANALFAGEKTFSVPVIETGISKTYYAATGTAV